MNSLPTGNPRIPEGINASEDNPLKEFFLLLAGVTASIVVIVGMLSLFARILAPYIPFHWENALSPSIMEFVGGTIGESTTPEREQALQRLSQNLLTSSLEIAGLGEEPNVPSEAFSFHLIKAGIPNAFATLGGHIIVTDKLLDEIVTENGLAMVIAHEIAHIQLRHPIEAAGRGVVIQLSIAALMDSSNSNISSNILTGASTFTLLGFNRDMESEADERALLILRAHYGHVAGADEFFTAMNKDGAMEEWLEFAQTHPNTERRLERIREAMALDIGPVVLTPLPTRLQSLEN